jgi:uncharacterized RDD family membrane protein YckC
MWLPLLGKDKGNSKYSTINRRMLAVMIDFLILSIVFTPISWVLSLIYNTGMDVEAVMERYVDLYGNTDIDLGKFMPLLVESGILQIFLLQNIFSLLIIAVFYIFFDYRYGATPGKMVMRCRVVNYANDHRLSLKQASTRFFGVILEALTLGISFIFANFAKDNRSFHDKLSSSAVINVSKKGF